MVMPALDLFSSLFFLAAKDSDTSSKNPFPWGLSALDAAWPQTIPACLDRALRACPSLP